MSDEELDEKVVGGGSQREFDHIEGEDDDEEESKTPPSDGGKSDENW